MQRKNPTSKTVKKENCIKVITINFVMPQQTHEQLYNF